jgi:hypothetical protein
MPSEVSPIPFQPGHARIRIAPGLSKHHRELWIPGDRASGTPVHEDEGDASAAVPIVGGARTVDHPFVEQ